MVHKKNHTIKHLLQLQEMVVARAQQQAALPKQRLLQLEKNIQTLTDELAPDLRGHFGRLLQKSIEAIVPVTGENCSGCGFVLTKTMVNSIHAGDSFNRCPNCTRILYAPDVPLLRTAQRRRWSDPVKRGIERFSAPGLMIPKLQSETKEEVLLELCENMCQQGYVEECHDLHKAALRREAIVSTAVGNAIAFPHVRSVEGGGLTLSLGIHKKGIKFGAPNDRLTKVFFYMVIPTAASAFYLKLLSGLTQSFSTAAQRDTLLKVKTQEDLWNALTLGTKKSVI